MIIRRYRQFGLIIWCLVILGLSSIPQVHPGPPLFPHADKLAHFLIYGVLGAFAGWQHPASQRLTWLHGIVLGVAIAVFAAADEWYQMLIPGRSSDPADWIADLVGGVLGLTAVASVHNHRWHREKRGEAP